MNRTENDPPNGIDSGLSSHDEQSGLSSFRHWRLFVVLALAMVVAGVWGWQYSLNVQLSKVKRAAARSDWDDVLVPLNRYLQHRPDDAEARLLLAEAYVGSAGRGGDDIIQLAIFHLQQIEENSPVVAKARLQEARLSLFLLKKPAAAERLLKETLRLDAESVEANLLMWQLLDLTGRHVDSGPYFWRAYELTAKSQQGQLLRDWFLSEFYPDQLYAELFRQMKITAVGKIPASVNLMVQFREAEPSASFLHAAIAEHFHGAGNLKGAIDLLNECPDVPAAMTDPLFVAVLLETLIDLGEFQKAGDCFQEFPQPHDGYLFWRSESMYFDYVRNNSGAAVASYQKALATPPAKFDWGLMTRLSVCLKKTGQLNEGEKVQARVEDLTRQVLTLEHTSHLRNLLMRPMQPENAAEFVDFYGKFDLAREVSAWSDYKRGLEEAQPSAGG